MPIGQLLTVSSGTTTHPRQYGGEIIILPTANKGINTELCMGSELVSLGLALTSSEPIHRAFWQRVRFIKLQGAFGVQYLGWRIPAKVDDIDSMLAAFGVPAWADSRELLGKTGHWITKLRQDIYAHRRYGHPFAEMVWNLDNRVCDKADAIFIQAFGIPNRDECACCSTNNASVTGVVTKAGEWSPTQTMYPFRGCISLNIKAILGKDLHLEEARLKDGACGNCVWLVSATKSALPLKHLESNTVVP